MQRVPFWQLWEQSVERCGGEIALHSESVQLSYRQLDQPRWRALRVSCASTV